MSVNSSKKQCLSPKLVELKEDLKMKETILDVLLRKKNCKYHKLPGTKIVKAYDPSLKIKTFLGFNKQKSNNNTSSHFYQTEGGCNKDAENPEEVLSWIRA